MTQQWGQRSALGCGLGLVVALASCAADRTANERPSVDAPPPALRDAGTDDDASPGEDPFVDRDDDEDRDGGVDDGDVGGDVGNDGDGDGDDGDGGPGFGEPALPPPLSFFFAQQRERLEARRDGCGLPAAASLPAGLVEHLTTRVEYDAHLACLADVDAAPCTSSLVQGGELAAAPRCLWAEPTVYDVVDPPARCPSVVDDFTFDPRREQFSLHNAYWLLWMATACNLAEPALITAEFASRGFADVRVVQFERLTVAVVERDDFVVFVFKGSTGTSDYLSNASYVMKSSDDTGLPGRVHSGFYATLASGLSALEPELVAARDRGKPIFFVGHSLGGACAQMAALKALDLGVEVAQLYAFSSPRVGDATFAAALEGLLGNRLHRINNGLDITPHVPPSTAAEDPAREAIVELVGDADNPGFWLGSLSATLQAGLLLADYTHAGDAWAFDERGYLQALHPYRDEDEIPYWEQLPDVVGEDNLLDVTRGFGQLPAYHDDGTHLCYQARAIDQLLYRRHSRP
jgi:hypothetical protein